MRSPSVRSRRSDIPWIRSAGSTRSGRSGSERAKDSKRRVKAAQRKVDPADDHGEHVVEVVRDAAGQLTDRLHLLDLAELGFSGLTLGRFLLQRLVGFPQLLSALAHRLLEL